MPQTFNRLRTRRALYRWHCTGFMQHLANNTSRHHVGCCFTLDWIKPFQGISSPINSGCNSRHNAWKEVLIFLKWLIILRRAHVWTVSHYLDPSYRWPLTSTNQFLSLLVLLSFMTIVHQHLIYIFLSPSHAISLSTDLKLLKLYLLISL